MEGPAWICGIKSALVLGVSGSREIMYGYPFAFDFDFESLRSCG